MCVYGNHFDIDHAMICGRGKFVIKRHNKLRDLEVELLSMVCNNVEVGRVLHGGINWISTQENSGSGRAAFLK